MSTKIYEAYRVPIRRLNRLIDVMDEAMFKNALSRVKKLMGAVTDEFARKFVKEKYDVEPGHARYANLVRFARFQKVMDEAKVAANKSERDPLFCLDCGVNVWIYQRRAYLIPHGEAFLHAKMGSKLEALGWVEEYAYHNSTDDQVCSGQLTLRQWHGRRDVWNRVCLEDWNARRLYHEVVTMRTPDAYIPSQVRFEMALFPDRHKHTTIKGKAKK